jgi:phosphoglycolate phosphatase-like HAD superfamily hydrolase
MTPDVAIIFDVEGTLIDCIAQILECWQAVLAAHGCAVDRKVLHRYVGMDPRRMLRTLLPDASAADIACLAEEQGERYRRRHLHRVRPFPGVEAMFADLAASARLALATSCTRPELDAYLENMRISRYLGATVCGDDVAKGKPAPDLLGLARSRIGAHERVLAVGDTPYDAEAAQAIGATAIATEGGGFTKVELLNAGFAAVGRNPDELTSLLRRHM